MGKDFFVIRTFVMADATIWWVEALREAHCGQVVVIHAVFGNSVGIKFGGSMSGSQLTVASRDGGIGGWRH